MIQQNTTIESYSVSLNDCMLSSTSPENSGTRTPIVVPSPSPSPTPDILFTVTPKEMGDWYTQFATELQAEEEARQTYYGKYVQWVGLIKDIRPEYGDAAQLDLDVDGTHVFASFDRKQDVETLSPGLRVTVLCEIRSIGGTKEIGSSYISLVKCRLLRVNG